MNDCAAQLVYDGKAELAEGPVWHQNSLWWVNINAGSLNRLDPISGFNVSRATGDFLGVAVPTNGREWLIAGSKRISRMDWFTGKMVAVAMLPECDSGMRCNDGKCDPRGRFFVGQMHRHGRSDEGALFQCLGGRMIAEVSGISISNGLDWSRDGSRFYYTDTPTQRVDVFDYDVDSGKLLNRRPLVSIPPERGAPDGLCCDADGNLWVALWGGSGVECFDGRNGKSLARISVPARQVSSCCFGGANYNQLFITTAWQDCDRAVRDDDPLAGGIFVAEPGVQGQPTRLARL